MLTALRLIWSVIFDQGETDVWEDVVTIYRKKDVLEQIKDWAKYEISCPPVDLLNDWAAEIERLRGN